MPPVFKPHPPEVLRQWMHDIITESYDKLTMWELKFIGDMETLLNMGKILTQAQQDKLEQIYVAKTS